MSLQPGERHRPLVSLIIPALNESENVPSLLQRLAEIREEHGDLDFELVLIDDGSSDDTAERTLREAPAWLGLTVLRLARNFGSHPAISAGLQHCVGDCAIVLGADSQEPVHLVTDFIQMWKHGWEVVWGVRRTRARSTWAEFPSRVFSYLFARYAKLENYPPEGPSGVLLDRTVIDEVNKLRERNRNVLALIAWLGFRQTRVEYDLLKREHGQSKWTRRSLLKLAADSLIQFSTMPLRLCTFSGAFLAVMGVLYACALVVMALSGVQTPTGWPTLLVVVLVLGGVQLLVVGVLGEYLWRGVEETRERPLFVVRDVTRRQRGG